MLGKQLSHYQQPGTNAGFLLPNMAPSVVAFFGMRAFNITPCMLNFSTGVKNMLACCQAAQVHTVFTSKKFLEQGGLLETAAALEQAGLKLVYLEDVQTRITWWDKWVGGVASVFPRR